MLTWLKRKFRYASDAGNASVDDPGLVHQQKIVSLAQSLKAEGDAYFHDGKLTEAEQCYRRAISIDPGFARAYCNLGYVLKELGRYDEALSNLCQVVEIQPDIADAYYAQGTIFAALAKSEDAIAFFKKALELDPRLEFAHRDLCLLLVQNGRFIEAKEAVLIGIHYLPASAEFHFFLGNLLHGESDFKSAVSHFQKTLELTPHRADAHVNLGLSLQSLGDLDNALAAFDRALEINSAVADWQSKRGCILQRLERPHMAIACFQEAIKLQPDFAEGHANLGSVLHEIGELDAALASYNKALALEPQVAQMHFNVGTILHEQLQLERALACYSNALAINDKHINARVNIAAIYSIQGKFNEAMKCYDELLHGYSAIASNLSPLQPDTVLADIHNNRGMLALLCGDYSLGWAEYEHRWNCTINPHQSHYPQPQWRGDVDISGKRILLYAEQGLGDTLQFIRYTKLVAARGAIVFLLVPQPLKSLAESSPGVSAVFGLDEALPVFDYQCPLMSLPFAFKTELSTIPADIPYLKCNSERIAHWRAKAGKASGLRVGLVWSGDPRKHSRSARSSDRIRSLNFDQMRPLLEIPGVEFFSLQLGQDAVAQLQGCPQVKDYTAELYDFQETAALMESLDLVISVDTSVAHLAGAVGKHIWLLNRRNTCWRWLWERTDSPWYPTLRVFRQPDFGDWETVITDVRNALIGLAQSIRK